MIYEGDLFVLESHGRLRKATYEDLADSTIKFYVYSALRFYSLEDSEKFIFPLQQSLA